VKRYLGQEAAEGPGAELYAVERHGLALETTSNSQYWWVEDFQAAF
jgi:hypothetical protein